MFTPLYLANALIFSRQLIQYTGFFFRVAHKHVVRGLVLSVGMIRHGPGNGGLLSRVELIQLLPAHALVGIGIQDHRILIAILRGGALLHTAIRRGNLRGYPLPHICDPRDRAQGYNGAYSGNKPVALHHTAESVFQPPASHASFHICHGQLGFGDVIVPYTAELLVSLIVGSPHIRIPLSSR